MYKMKSKESYGNRLVTSTVNFEVSNCTSKHVLVCRWPANHQSGVSLQRHHLPITQEDEEWITN